MLTTRVLVEKTKLFLKTHTNVRELLVIQKELKLPYNPNMTLPGINMEVKLAHAKRRKCKESTESMSLEYRTQLVLAKEKDITAAKFLRNMNNTEAVRRLYRNIRRMEGKIKGGSTYKVTKKINGLEHEYTD